MNDNLNDNLNDKILLMQKQMDHLNSLKKKVEENQLQKRSDVQIIQQKIAKLNREIMFSDRDVENKQKLWQIALQNNEALKKEHKKFTSHLELITDAHKKERTCQLNILQEKIKEFNL
tara:strand:- start:230 stop:583 length:354 start_codon:yes stop_codon:yes gene_type:complete